MSGKSEQALEAENAELRVRVEALERELHPPPPPPKTVDEPRRYLLAARAEGRPWGDIAELMTGWALDDAREHDSEMRWHTVYRWDDIPAAGIYTTVNSVLGARRTQAAIPLYEIDWRTNALAEIKAQNRRVHGREDEVIDSFRAPLSLDEHRLLAHRAHLLGQAMIRLGRPFRVACRPLPDYDDIIRGATKIADGALADDRLVQLSDIPGYLPDQRWECQDCGYPFDDSEAYDGGTVFSCRACAQANPIIRRQREELGVEAR